MELATEQAKVSMTVQICSNGNEFIRFEIDVHYTNLALMNIVILVGIPSARNTYIDY